MRRLLFLFVFVSAMLAACEEERTNPNKDLTLEAFSELRTPALALNSHRIREQLGKLMRGDADSLLAAQRVRSYYQQQRPFLWIDRRGLDSRADTLLARLEGLAAMGLDTARFCLAPIRRDLTRIRTLDVADAPGALNEVMARVEYNLTKAYLRYAVGMKFGFVNPERVLNQLDVRDSDSVRVTYHRLYDVKTRRATDAFYEAALQKIAHDSVGVYLAALEPQSALYRKLKARLGEQGVSKHERMKILCNMERQRWQQGHVPDGLKKYVLVNIPAFKLTAVCPDSTLEMRVGCGTLKTKTPMLTSEIHRMDINPQWILPRSIVEKDIVRHAGNAAYFERRRMFVRERRSGKKILPQNVTWAMLQSKDYMVVQEGGEGNSLGRIIFRFDNNFSVFLHDTSTRAFFARDNRGVSHGCVRVEHPLELALFLMDKPDQELADKIAYSMTARLGTDATADDADGETPVGVHEEVGVDRSRLVKSVQVEPHVPLFITYYTLYPDAAGNLCEYPDVYGYDRAIYRTLKSYVE